MKGKAARVGSSEPQALFIMIFNLQRFLSWLLGLRRKAEQWQGKQLCQETSSRHFVLSYSVDFQGNDRGELYSFSSRRPWSSQRNQSNHKANRLKLERLTEWSVSLKRNFSRELNNS